MRRDHTFGLTGRPAGEDNHRFTFGRQLRQRAYQSSEVITHLQHFDRQAVTQGLNFGAIGLD